MDTDADFDATECKRALHKYLAAHAALRELFARGLTAEQAKKAPFHVRPKRHMLLHVADDLLQLWGNPRNFWCYADEAIYPSHFVREELLSLHARSFVVQAET